MMRLTEKPWWQSKTVWGGAIAVLCGFAGLFFNLNIDAGMQAEIVDYIISITTGLGGLMAIYGRIKAEHTIRH